MPQLNVIQSQSLLPMPGSSANPEAAAQRFTSAIGDAIGTVAHEVQRHQQEQGVVQTQNAIGRMTLKIQQMRSDADSLVPNAVDQLNQSDDPIANIDAYSDARAQRAQMLSPDAVGKAIDSMASDESKGINGVAQPLFSQRVAELRSEAMLQAQHVQTVQRQQALVDGITSATDTSARIAANDHNQYPFQMAQLRATIDAMDLPPEVKAEKMRQASSTLAMAAGDGLVARYPNAALAGLNNYFGIPTPAAPQPSASPPAGGAAAAGSSAPAPSAGGDDWTAVNAAAEAARYSPDRIPVLQAEIDKPETTAASRAALQGEIDQIHQRMPQPAETLLTGPAAVKSLEDRGGQPGDARLPFLNALSPAQALDLRNRALEAVQRGRATMGASLEARSKDYQAMVLAGVAPPAGSAPTPDEYAAAFGPAGAQRYETEVGTYTRLGVGLAQLQTASYADRQAVIARAVPTPGPGFEEQQKIQGTLAQANALMEKQIATDPAAYASKNSPAVQQASAKMQATLSDITSTPAQRAAVVDAYALATTAEQQRLGIGQIKSDVLGQGGTPRQLGPRLLTNADANAIARTFYGTDGKGNPANAAQLMDGLQAQWGSHFPEVYAQLAQDEKLPPAAMVIPNMSDPFAKETLARYSDPKLQKDMVENLPAGASKDISAQLQQLNEPFFNTLAFQQGGQRTFDTVLEQQRTLAGAYVMQGRSASDAARIAFQQTVGHQYVFADTLRIPKAEQPNLVQSGLGSLQMAPERLGSTPPPSYRPGLAQKDRDAAWLDAIKSNASWVANADESGATLLVRGRTDTGADVRYPVPGPDGKTPLSWNWSQLRAIGMTNQAKARAIFENAPAIQDVPMSGGGF